MIKPQDISITDYTYFLPEERIANYPLAKRDDARLLIYKDKQITNDLYSQIDNHIPEGSLLVFNNTKVVEARLLFQKTTGGVIEIFCLEPHEKYADITSAMSQQKNVLWKCLVGGASKWKPGQSLEKKIQNGNIELLLKADYIEKRSDYFIIALSWTPVKVSFAEVLHLAGAIPLPPYIKRPVEETDKERYQTVYAQHDGSVAAPTAGLHFTGSVLEKLKNKKIQTDFVTLHVGAGTFKPVKAATMQEHEMHAEWIDVPIETIMNILDNMEKNIIAVGTTSLRTIESLYWLGMKTLVKKDEWRDGQPAFVSQWEIYDLAEKNISTTDALRSLLNWMEKNKLQRLIAKTQILIAPGYDFKIVKALITNFHQPQSTLLLLVAALIGKDWKSVYDYALQNNFRFLSYGDGSLLWKNQQTSQSLISNYY